MQDAFISLSWNSHSLFYISMGLFFFLFWVIIKYYSLYFIVQKNLATWELFQLVPVTFWDSHINAWFESFFLALQHALPSSCVFTASVLESAISSESWFLLLWNGIRNQDLGTMCVSCLGTVIAFRPSQQMKEKIHVYVLPPVCICNFYK